MSAAALDSIADLLKTLGGISPKRIRMKPSPGRATEKDVVRIQEREGRLYELVDGTLVEKIMGYPESYLAACILTLLKVFVDRFDLGLVSGADGLLRLMPHQVRIPDVAFVSWSQLPKREVPMDAVANLYPDLAVEVVSKGNTKREMRRKLREYFQSGSRLVWLVYPKTHSVTVYTAPDQSTEFSENDALDGGEVLPGLTLPVRSIFELMPKVASSAAKSKSARKKPG